MAKPPSQWAARAEAVRRAETDNFADLIELSGLEPGRDLAGKDWSGVDFSGCDLAGFNLSGSYLHGCRFDGARIAEAFFEGAEIGRVLHDSTRDPHLPAMTTEVADLRKAVDWSSTPRAAEYRARVFADCDRYLRVGSIFQDAPFAPQMVVVPSGTFAMGSPDDEMTWLKLSGNNDRERPRSVKISRGIAIGRFPVTFEEWDFAQSDSQWIAVTNDVPRRSGDEGWGRGRRPVIDVNWNEAREYCLWLSRVTSQKYRLPSEAEWEYCCRASTKTSYNTGNSISLQDAKFSSDDDGDGLSSVAVGTYAPNAWGIYDMHGNVFEWCQDELVNDAGSLPTDGRAYESRANGGDRVVRGGSWYVKADDLRSAARNWRTRFNLRDNDLGFRVVREIDMSR